MKKLTVFLAALSLVFATNVTSLIACDPGGDAPGEAAGDPGDTGGSSGSSGSDSGDSESGEDGDTGSDDGGEILFVREAMPGCATYRG